MSRLPPWLRRPTGMLGDLHEVKAILREGGLHTVCESARCPNIGECFRSRTATFLLLGPVCSRRCRFCSVEKGAPSPPDPGEPRAVAEASARLKLRHVVLTMVTRDDLLDSGAGHVAETIRRVRERSPGATVEVLTSDFQGSAEALGLVLAERPTVFNHNLETVPRLYPRVRPQAVYARSLRVLEEARRIRPEGFTKSGLMVGLGETEEEVLAVLRDLRSAGCDAVTVGQYLRPRRECLEVERYWRPEELNALARQGRAMGFKEVFAGPFVRSSFHAGTLLERLDR